MECPLNRGKPSCRQVLRDLRDSGENPQPPAITEQTLCAGETDKTPWYGDSGGPLLVDTPDGWAQVGVLSQATNNPDGSVGYLGNYMRTSYFWDWIFPTYFLHFAHSARGGGWRTDLVLLNPERDAAEATVDLFGQTGSLGNVAKQFNLQELSMVEWELLPGIGVETGGVVVSSAAKLSGFLRFRHSGGAALSVQAAPVASAFMVPVSEQVDRVGVAVFNAGDEEVTAVFRLGARVFYETLPAQGKMAKFVDELFPSAPTGTLLVSADGGEITVLALELVGTSLITLPATPLN